jgi:hypothetical protein
MGVNGKNTPEHRIGRIHAILTDESLSKDAKFTQIQREAVIIDDEPNTFLGEDYWWCDLATKSGFTIHLDTMLVMGHSGRTTLPIPDPQAL